METSNDARRHVSRMMALAEGREVEGLDHLPDTVLQTSWARSIRRYKLDPGRRSIPKVVPAAVLREHRERAETFMRIARHGLGRLFEQVHPAGYMTFLEWSPVERFVSGAAPAHTRAQQARL